MDNAEDTYVVVIIKDTNSNTNNQNLPIKENDIIGIEENEDTLPVEELIKAAEEHGEHIELINNEDYYQYEHIEDGVALEDGEKGVCDSNYVPKQSDESEQDISDSDEVKSHHCLISRKPKKTLVRDLIEENPIFKTVQKALIDTLVVLMKNVEVPPLPKDYFIMNGINFECSKCGEISGTIPAVSRHYREKHGERYLICFACGADFRRSTELYRHEKNCTAPDADVVLKARAIYVGRKGRSRPFLQHDPNENIEKKPQKFFCDQCSAVFSSKITLLSHLNHHQGIRPYQCKHCQNAYTRFSTLVRHEKKHSSAQFICDHCGRSFKLKEILNTHMDSHRPLKKHPCNECDRRFAQKSALLLHINRVHRNLPPPCACQICPKRFARMSLLKTHMQKAHGMLLMTRRMFFKTLPIMPDTELEKAKVVLQSEVMQSQTPYILQTNNLKS